MLLKDSFGYSSTHLLLMGMLAGSVEVAGCWSIGHCHQKNCNNRLLAIHQIVDQTFPSL